MKLPAQLNKDTITNKLVAEFFLPEIVSIIKGTNKKLTVSDNPRVDSSKNEKEIYEIIKTFSISNEKFHKTFQLYVVESNTNIEWFDLAIKSYCNPKIFVPINLKVTKGNNSDNLNCKLGLYWAMTGLQPNFSNSIRWDKLASEIFENINTYTDNDYYFLVISKNDNKDTFYTSLKTIKTLTPNGNNLPFQCVWKNNKERYERDHNEAVRYIFDIFMESFNKRNAVGENVINQCQMQKDKGVI